ncbi:MAG: hypothetical protein GJ677_02345 [Rhodobacteraceae bacterium]|nr:hypothetical protein [Paracoccaceae bacterium]
MRTYDPDQPLIFIHVPKTAGQSVYTIFHSWFPDTIHRHYYSSTLNRPPSRLDLRQPSGSNPPLIFGHFNRDRGFGIEQYYPEVSQFVSILRDPFEMHLSRYFYVRRWSAERRRNSDIQDRSLTDHLQNSELKMLVHFPREVTRDNYRDIIEEFFVDIGCVETLGPSLKRIGQRLGKPVEKMRLPKKNVTPRDLPIPDGAYDDFRTRWPLEFDIYDYVRSLSPASHETTKPSQVFEG